jgi:hypothetical protein
MHSQERSNIMEKKSISQKSNKGVQFGRIITVQPKVGSVKSVGEPKVPACDSKVNLSEPATELTHQRIAEQARLIWQSRGCRAGEDERNWYEAKAHLKAELGIN